MRPVKSFIVRASLPKPLESIRELVYNIEWYWNVQSIKLFYRLERNLWEEINFENTLLRTRNTNRFSFGVEFPSPGLNKGTSKMVFYRFGAEYRESYLIIDNTPISYRAISFGAGIPLKSVLSVINLSLELGQNGTVTNELFKESFITFHIDMALRDLWFMKRRYM